MKVCIGGQVVAGLGVAVAGEGELAGMQATPGLLCSKKPQSQGVFPICVAGMASPPEGKQGKTMKGSYEGLWEEDWFEFLS